ncbi:helix-turn-helix transcriptional regulator [Chryseobacterium sp.]|uniref:helix-turn-helix transcriptional regulator n=1 Tax=Chryseobacterium sp. TaxID=1871047 RepID=UPI002FC86687
MTEEDKKVLTTRMCENLAILRMKLGVSQQALGEKAGVSRFTIAALENQKREMTWNNFLALLMIFTKNNNTDELLTVFKIYTEELNEMLKR